MSIRHWFGCWPGVAIGFDGASETSVCAECGRTILRDSQGNWFPVASRTTDRQVEP